jgi:hypothetical protein
MITFELGCDEGHRFEGWFCNREALEEQLANGLLECPVCGSTRVEKRLSPVAVHVGRRAAPSAPPAPTTEPPKPAPQAFFKAFAEFVETHFEDVGPGFASEARKIEHGEAEGRNIRGTTTSAEEEALREEGIEFMKIALPKYDA